ncbi:Csu type fimbrial protein [Alloalcanivorax xenomutans]|uniref:Csu type fimbrial protein n=1 Tax=Alloalcanivorax xenomutans TaxID=1094342 RepID=UPI0024E22FB8|nr:spore coat U domain-containing protein [Alloalcanivorax xenomutans]
MRSKRYSTSSRLWLAGLVAAASGSAFAADETTTFDVTATVTAACSVSAADLAFGNYDRVLGTLGTTTITSNCTLATPYTLSLDFGGAANVSSRVMDGPNSETLSYQLTQDVAGLIPWGTVADGDEVSLLGTGLDVPTVVYGQIPSGQNVEAGSYSDTITVTLTY